MKRLTFLLMLMLSMTVSANGKLSAEKKQELTHSVQKILTDAEDTSHPMTKRAHKAVNRYFGTESVMTTVNTGQSTSSASDGLQGVMILFISASMPVDTIKAYLAQGEIIKHNLLVVLKGTIDNTLRLRPTLSWLFNIKQYDGCGQPPCQREINTVVDPRLFEHYQIDRVPTLVYSPSMTHSMYFKQRSLPENQAPIKVVGDASLPFMISTIEQESQNEEVRSFSALYSF